METGAKRPVTRDQAEEALRTADAEERGTRLPPIPRWWYPAAAAAVLGLFLLNTVDEPEGGARIAAVAADFGLIALVVVVTAVAMRRAVAYRGLPMSRGRLLVGGVIGLAVVVVPLVLQDALGSWVWAPAGVVMAALLIASGVVHDRARRG